MNRSSMLPSILVGLLGVTIAAQVWAVPEYARQTKLACATCHAIPAGGVDLTAAGKAFKADGKAPAAGTAKAAEYVGVNKCKMCHIKQYKAWSTTPHAKAWAGLQNADPAKAAELAAAFKIEIKGSPAATDECVTCHVVGFHLTGGFPQADSTKNAAVSNVACEACHGPGSLHVAAATAVKKKFINRSPGVKLCMQCHTETASPKFDFAERSKKIHPTAS